MVEAVGLDELVPVHLGHHEIQQHQPNAPLSQHLQRLLAVAGRLHREILALENPLKPLARRLVILHHEDGQFHAGGQQLGDGIQELFPGDGFLDVFRRPQRVALGVIVHHGHDHQRDVPQLLVILELREGLAALQAIGGQIDGDDVGVEGPRHLDAVGAVLRHGHPEPFRGQDLGDGIPQDGIVLDDQDLAPVLGPIRLAALEGPSGFHHRDHRQMHGKDGSLPGLARDLDITAKEDRETAAEGQAQSGSTVLPRGGFIRLREFLEDAVHLFRGHADARIRDREADEIHALRIWFDLQYDHAVLGELGGVVEQIVEDLPEHLQIGMNGGDARILLQHQPVLVPVDQGFDGHGDVGEHSGNVAVFQVDRHPSRFDLGEIEDVVDEAQQVLPSVLDLVEIGHHGFEALLPHLVHQQFAIEKDRVEGCAELVAHVRHEGALGTVGFFRRLLGYEQLCVDLQELLGALGDQVFQVFLVVHELDVPVFDLLQHAIQGIRQNADLAADVLSETCRVLLGPGDILEEAKQVSKGPQQVPAKHEVVRERQGPH